MSLRNGMWQDLRNVIIMRNTIYARNKLAKERVMFSRKFCNSSWPNIKQLNNKVRVKKSMKTVYSFRIQGTI